MPKRFRRHLILLLVVVLVHGWVFLMDGTYWDGAIIFRAQSEHDWMGLRAIFSDVGLPLFYYLHRALGAFPGVFFGYRAACVLSFAVIGSSLLALLDASKVWSPRERLLTAILAIAYPAYRVGFELIVVPYGILYAAFALATVLLEWSSTLALDRRRARDVLIMKGASAVLYAVSFSLNSLLVVYWLALAFVFGRNKPHEERAWPWLRRTLRERRGEWPFLALPFAFYALTKTLFPVHGSDENYNRISFSPRGTVSALVASLKDVVLGQWRDALRVIPQHPLVAAACAVVAIALAWRASSEESPSSPVRRVGGFAVVWLLVSLVPYALVGKIASIDGWSTRHALLACAPCALLAMVGIRLLAAKHARVELAISLFVAGLFASVLFFNYVRWEARWAYDLSTIAGLREVPAPPASILAVDRRLPSAGEAHYRFYEWAALFEKAWSTPDHVGFEDDITPAMKIEAKRVSEMHHFYGAWETNFDVCSDTLHVERASGDSELTIATRYERNRFFAAQEMSPWLLTITRVRLVEGCSL